MSYAEREKLFMRSACKLCDNSKLDVKTGCLVVSGENILASGWNDPKYHAEINALEGLLRLNRGLRVDMKDYEVYTTRFPCDECSRELVKNGLRKLYFMSDHFTSNNSALPFLLENGVEITQISEDKVWEDTLK